MRIHKLLAVASTALSLLVPLTSFAEWQRDDTTLAWRSGDRVLWRFSYDPAKGKPFFDPLTTSSGMSLTRVRSPELPWHYGLWFSWKLINGANYWEEDRQSGKSEGSTRWSVPRIQTHADGSAVIEFTVSYTHPSGRVDMTEQRKLEISRPASDGSYSIHWHSHFMAGKDGAVLDRTPMPGEPGGKVNGGYGGLGLSLASAPVVMYVLTTAGPITHYDTDRARPSAPAIAANFTLEEKNLGSIAILSDRANIGENAPWYVVNAESGLRFICAAVLAPQVRSLRPGGEWKLHYRILVQPKPWTPNTLRAAVKDWGF
jgi:Methane oxygenase PmoA